MTVLVGSKYKALAGDAFLHVDDMLIKLWDWDKKWQCSQVFEGHTHYVMMVVLNPKDYNQFASASLDKTIKVSNGLLWSTMADTATDN